MREIKFRAWDKENKRMLPVDYMKLDFGKVLYVNGETFSKDDGWFDYELWDDKFELMQYIGLKDKNGVEIYEGDIIRAKFIKDDTTAIGRVSYFDKDTSFVCHLIDGDYARVHCLDDIKVIGNAYEDPDTTENLPNTWDLDVKIGVNSDNKAINLSKFDKKDVIVGMDNTNGYFWAKVKDFVLNCLCIRSKK